MKARVTQRKNIVVAESQPHDSVEWRTQRTPQAARLIALQQSAGNQAACHWINNVSVQGAPNRFDDDDPTEQSRRSRPRNAPRGTVPIDESGLDRETIHKIKRQIGADPDTWVGITADGHVVTSDADGNVEDHGHISDFQRTGVEQIPRWVWGLLAVGSAIALIVLFATGVGEVGLILAGLGWAATAVVLAILRSSRREGLTTASADAGSGLENSESA